MKNLNLTKIEYIKEFLKTKGYIWEGRIRDPLRMMFRQATIEDFENKRMVRLMVTTENNKTEFVQRVIVSDITFKIENTKLNKIDNFEDFTPEWLGLLSLKETKKSILRFPYSL